MGKMSKNPIKRYLIKRCQAHKSHVFEGNYRCLEEFVLKNGRSFEVIKPLPPTIKEGKLGNCFNNAYWVALENKDKYYYCEGYAALKNDWWPVLHAWVVNRKLEAIDPTWPSGKYYYGLIFKLSYLHQWLLNNKGHRSTIDNWMQGWPLLKDSPKELQEHTLILKR